MFINGQNFNLPRVERTSSSKLVEQIEKFKDTVAAQMGQPTEQEGNEGSHITAKIGDLIDLLEEYAKAPTLAKKTPVAEEKETKTVDDIVSDTTDVKAKSEANSDTEKIQLSLRNLNLKNFIAVFDMDKPITSFGLGLRGSKEATRMRFGCYDNLLKRISNDDEQFKAYIKQELEAQGKKYDEVAVEKALNSIITKSLSELLEESKAGSRKIFISSVFDKGVPTLGDCFEKIIKGINEELQKEKPFEPEVNTAYNSVLSETADCLLDEEEKEMKMTLGALQNGEIYGTYDGAVSKLDLYSKHMKLYLQQKHPELSEVQIDAIIAEAKADSLANIDNITPDKKVARKLKKGGYDIEAVVRHFIQNCKTKVGE